MPIPSSLLTPLSFPLYYDGTNPSWALDFRMLAENETERLGILPSLCYHGLLCYQQDNETMYIYINTGDFNTRTNTVNDWKEFLGDVQLNVSPNTAVQFASGSPGVLSGSLDFVYDYNTQRVGLGLFNPQAKLHISGGEDSTLFKIDSGEVDVFNNPLSNIIYVSSSGFVGINTDKPIAKLHISGNTDYDDPPQYLLLVDDSLKDPYNLVARGGNIGIGHAQPNYKLHVSGGISAILPNQIKEYVVGYNTTTGELTYFSTSSLTIGGGGTINVEPNKAIQFASGSAGNEVLSGSLDFVYDYTATTNAGENGAVGIGTSTPSAKLDVAGTFQQGIFTQAIGIYSHAQGYNTTASGSYSHAEGNNTIASGSYSRSEGIDTIAYGDNSHAEGNFTKTYGNSSHAEGYNTIAYGENSHAEGSNTTAKGNYSHAEGVDSIASGSYSHAEGAYNTIAYGDYSHAEGLGSIASGSFSHAEGGGCISIGDGSNSKGWNTIAIGVGSNSSGQETISYADFETTIGRFNKDFGDGGRLFTVGNGITTNRNDILTISQIPLNQNSGWATGGIRMIDTNVIISGSRGVIVTGTHATAPSMYNKPESGSVAVLSVFNTPNSTIQVGSNSPTTAWGWINQDPTQDATTGILTGYQTGTANTVINDVSIFAEGKILSRELLVFSGGIKHLSDIRFKKNINEIKIEDATKLIKKVKPVTYNWDIKDDKSFSSGFIAQDFVKAGFEHIVSTTPNDEIKEYIDGDIKFYEGQQLSVDYLKVIPYQSKVIEYLLDKVEKLEEEINNLKKRNN